MSKNDNYKDVDSLLGGLFKPQSLKELFETKLEELEIAKTAVQDILGISYRALNGILGGTQKMVDMTNLLKIASFLQLPKEQVISLYVQSLEQVHPTSSVSPDKIKFIRENFDLAVLKKAGLIENITDFAEIEKKIVARLGLRSIMEYRIPEVDVAFSSVSGSSPKNKLSRAFWIQSATTCFEEINNPYTYDRDKLVNFFPQIRWHSTDTERGLVEIVKGLYKLGITVIYQPPLQSLKLHGATFTVNDKPCIVLTNYKGFYATLWFALIHELYHILFDWEEIKENRYHLTDDDNEQLSVKEREDLANNFASEYLFSGEKLAAIRPYLNDPTYVNEFGFQNHVHPSIIYAFSAFQSSKNDPIAWARARKNSPDFRPSVAALDIPWEDNRRIEEILQKRKLMIYN